LRNWPSLANGNMVIAGDEAQPNTEEGTHTGPNQGATPENGGSAGQPQSTIGGDADKE